MSLATKLQRAALLWAERGRMRVVSRIRDHYLAGAALKRRTGTAARSVTSEILPSGDGFRVGTNLSYLIAWEYGIRARTIVPRNAQALRFQVNGKWIFAKRAHIPAQAARPSFAPAMLDEEPYLRQSAQNLMFGVMVAHFPNRRIVIGGR